MHTTLKQLQHDMTLTEDKNISVICICTIGDIISLAQHLPYFSDHKTHRTIRHTLIFSFDFLEKNNDECILILVIYWKKTGLVHTKISNHNLIYSS